MAETIGDRTKKQKQFNETVAELKRAGWSDAQINNFMNQTEAIDDRDFYLSTATGLTIDECREFWKLCRHHKLVSRRVENSNPQVARASIEALTRTMSTEEASRFVKFLTAARSYVEEKKDPTSRLNQ